MIFFCYCLLIFFSNVRAEQPGDDYSVNSLNVGVLAEGWGPFQRWHDNQPSGFSVELIELLARNLGYSIKWHRYPQWIDIYNDACLGKIDIIVDSFNVTGRSCIVNSIPYYGSPSVIVVREDSKIFRDITHLQKAKIAIEHGFLTEELVKLHYPKANILFYDDPKKALNAVEIGDVDAYIGNLHVARSLTQERAELAVVAQSPLLMEALHIGANINKPWLEEEINKAIKSLSIKELGELKLRWLEQDPVTNLMGGNNFILRSEERVWLSKLPPLKRALPPNWPPFSFISETNKQSGLAIDYLTLMKDNLGIAYVDIPITHWSKLYELVANNIVDITILPMQRLSEMKDWHASNPFISFPVVIVNEKRSVQLSDITDLEGKHVFITDTMLIEPLRKWVPDIDISISNSAYEGLSKVYSGNADAYIGNLVTLTRLIAEHFDGDLKVAAPTPFKDELVIAVRTPFLPLLPLINRVLNSMTDKEIRQIRNSWLAVNYSEGITLHKLIKTLLPIGIGLAVVMVVLIFSYLKLKNEIKRRQKVELELVAARAFAENASNKKGEFLATMSHEIRTPMNGIVGMAEQLTFTELTQDQRQMVEVINRGAQGLHALIDNVLDFAKLEAGKMQLEQAPFLVRELIDSVLTMTVSEVHRKGLRVYLWADAGVAARVSGDALRLRQILFNFVSNAIKFTERGFIEISVQLLAQGEGQQQLRFGVRDSGIGMSPEALGRIFNAFEQAESSTTRSYGGTGLGLSICQTLATLMGGEIRLESAPGLGTFITLMVTLPVLAQREPDLRLNGVQAYIDLHDEKLCHTLLLHLDALGVMRTSQFGDARLRFSDHELAAEGSIRVLPLATPLGYRCDEGRYLLNSNPMTWHAVREVCYRQLGLNDDPAPQSMRKSAQSAQSAPMLPYRVLLVEDNPLNQSLVIRQLRQLELSCDLAEHGQQALEMVAQHSYDLVLCDCQMPVMDGYEFTRRVRAAETGERLLIIAMTANVLPEQATRCFAAGMDDLLGKPVLQDALRQMLQKWQILPAPTLIDVAAMAAFFGQGDKLRQMFPLFRQELEQSMAQEPLDDNGLANWVHRQAGTISMMMAPQLAEQAWQLEEKIRQFGSPSCADELTSFRAQLQQIIGELTLLSERDRHSVIEGELE